jgi:hypothetical protein
MSTRNVILGLCAAGFAVGSAVASAFQTPYIAVGAGGEERSIGDINPCSGTGNTCKVKLRKNGVTIPGFTIATLKTALGATVTSSSSTVVIVNVQ